MAVKTNKKSRSRRSRTDQRELSRPGLSKFAGSLLREWKRSGLPTTNARILVAVSGGADSVALLLSLDELVKANKLKNRIHVAHVDHRLRKSASADARWVRELAQRLNHNVSISRVDVKRLAKQNRDNVEQAARRARYKCLAQLAQKHDVDIVLTAHTMDDQAETVLMNLLRGSGADGLRGIEPARRLSDRSEILLARPLLSWARRDDTEQYCKLRAVEFRRDEMNTDENFARVRARRRLLPLMQSFNPKVVEALARTAELLRDDSDALESAAARLLDLSAVDGTTQRTRLRTDLLAAARPALRRRALRRWLSQQRGNLRRLELVHIRSVENLLVENRGRRTVELPGGATVSRSRGFVIFHRPARYRERFCQNG